MPQTTPTRTKIQPPRMPRPMMIEDQETLAAQLALDQLQERAEAATLRRLAHVYGLLAEQSFLDAAVIELSARLRDAARARDRHLTCSDVRQLVDGLRASGVQVYDPDAGDHPGDLRRVGFALRRLAREAAEAAEGIA